jgi:cytochrome P450
MMQFLIAGYETTALTISHCCYILATKPEELQKLQDEIDSNIDPEVSFILKHFSTQRGCGPVFTGSYFPRLKNSVIFSRKKLTAIG